MWLVVKLTPRDSYTKRTDEYLVSTKYVVILGNEFVLS